MTNTTIIIPTYNEAENIPLLAQELREKVDGQCNILIVDDSPTPETVSAANNEGWNTIWRSRGYKVIKGLSPAVIDGIKASQDVENIIVMDADLQHPPRTAAMILNLLKFKYDFVVASRYKTGGRIDSKWGLKRRLISKVANWLAMPLMKFKVKDMMSGFFGFRLSGLPNLDNIKPQGYKIGMELLVKGNWENIVEVPYTFGTRQKGESKLSSKQIWEYLWQLTRLYFDKFRFLRFGIVGLSGVVINLFLLWLFTDVFGYHYMVGGVIGFFASVTNNYIWNYLWTFDNKNTELLTGWFKYLGMTIVTSFVYIGALLLITDLAGLWYILSALIAILLTFIGRYIIADELIWKNEILET